MQIADRYYGRVFLVVIGVLALASAFHAQPGTATAFAVLVSGVILLGLPHGALDRMVAAKAFSNYRFYSSIAFHAFYLILAVSYGLLWAKFPTLGLSSFLAIAAVHFGSDWQHRGIVLTRVAYGLTVVTLPALAHPGEVTSIYAALGTSHAAMLVDISKVLALTAAISAGIGAVMHFKQRASDLYEFLAIVLGAALLGPLIFFTCYFCLLHSPRHLLETAGGLGMASLKTIYILAAPIVLATAALGGLFWFLLPDISSNARILIVVFVGLASLTVPHMILDQASARPWGHLNRVT